MSADIQHIRDVQAYRELLVILQKPYQDICLACEGTGKLANAQLCLSCKGTGHRWLKLI
jgi:DnaJ-class molecular chaperone